MCEISGSGIGGTGVTAKESGIGGTGIIANGSGIGGTGISARVKIGVISGTITGFGSICVNGIEITYGVTTPVLDFETAMITNNLAIGEVVIAKVSGSGRAVTASEIRRLYVVEGPISEIDIKRQRVKVLGQYVVLTANTHFAGLYDESKLESQIQPYDHVVVSGLRRSGGEIIAGRIEKTPARSNTTVLGPITEITAEGFRIYGLNIETNHSTGLKLGQQVHVSGQYNPDGLIAQQIIETSKLQIPSVGEIAIMEGYVHDVSGVSQLVVGGITVKLPMAIQGRLAALNVNQRVIVHGLVASDNVIRANYLFVETEMNNFGEGILEKIDQQNAAKKPFVRKDSQTTNRFPNDSRSPKYTSSSQDPVGLQNPVLSKTDGSTDSPDLRRVDNGQAAGDRPVELAPSVNVPQGKVPDSKPPIIEPVEVNIPAIDVREVDLPYVDVPAVNIPYIEVPVIDVPQIEIPEIRIPVVDVPRVNVPEVQISR